MVILTVLIARRDMLKNVLNVVLKYNMLYIFKLKVEAMYRNELLDDIIEMVRLI